MTRKEYEAIDQARRLLAGIGRNTVAPASQPSFFDALDILIRLLNEGYRGWYDGDTAATSAGTAAGVEGTE